MTLFILIRCLVNLKFMAELILPDTKALRIKTCDWSFEIGLFGIIEGLIGDAFLSMFLMLVIHITRWAND